jgi:hypothetical protein
VLDDQAVSPVGEEVAIPALKAALLQSIENDLGEVLTLDTEIYLKAYVISSDENGNFFEELILQDSPVDPTAGIRVLIDANPLFAYFQPGRAVFIQLKGLGLGFENGQLTLGFSDGNRIRPIPESMLFDFLLRDSELAEIIPDDKLVSELSEDQINTFIRLREVQFNRLQALGEDRLTYAGEPEDQFDGERLLESCLEATSIIFSTSTFADFKSVLLPQGTGDIVGIFTYNFFGEEFNLVVNGLEAVQLENEIRCDPAEINCGLAVKSGEQVLFSDDFEEQQQGQPVAGNGWTNYSQEGTQLWEAYSATGSNASLGISARIGSYQSGDKQTISWLVTPRIDFDLQQDETLSFRTSNSFADGSTLELLFSHDWDGDVESISLASWELISAAILVSDDDFFGDWIFSGLVDLSCVEGSGYIAWKYVGSGKEDFDGTFELDEIEVRAN